MVTSRRSTLQEGLKAALDLVRGGDIARSLRDLYDDVGRRLLLSNLRDVALIGEASRLLTKLRGAWAVLAARSPAPALSPV